MKRIALALLLLLSIIYILQALPPLPTCYYTYDQLSAELFQLESLHSSIAKVYNIGHSQQDSLPIYIMKISDNVAMEEPEPAVLFIGQVHAEEVLGVQITMSNLKEILANRLQTPYNSWIAQLEMWFIPTLNPEGHNVVTSNIDVSYRKNKRDNNNNGIFDFSPLVGYDIDGVDINRNFPFNWCHGDTLMQPGGLEQYDYYRGPGPMSESESQALKDFCEAQRPVYCIIWHSSRTGNLSEKVFYPLNWYDVRPCPDLALGQQIGEGVAGQIIKENGSTGYEPSPSEGRKGSVNDWMYQMYGTIAMTVECGTSNLQPDSTLMVNTVARCTNGVKWLLNRALPISSAVPSSSMLTGTIRNAVTNEPLEAEIIIVERHAPWFAPRKSSPITGRYFRPVSNGTYTLQFRKKGYATVVINNQTVNNGNWTTVNVNMSPLNTATIQGSVRSTVSGNLIPASIKLYDIENDFLQTDGEFILNTFEGGHRIEIVSEGYYPYIDTLVVQPDVQSISLNVQMSPVNSFFTEHWENGLDNWVIDGPWVLQNGLSVSGYAITDSWGGRGWYAMNCDVSIRTQNLYQIPTTGNPLLMFDQHLHTEFVYDSVRVEVSSDNVNWQNIYSKSGQYDWWHPVYIPLSHLGGQNLYLRFRLTDQSAHVDLTDPGWTIDNIMIVTGTAVGVSTENVELKPMTVLYQNYPNPFKPLTNIRFGLNKDSKVSLDIYNIKGQKVKQLTGDYFKAGTHTLQWDGSDDSGRSVASGIYFYRMSADGMTKTQKMILLK